MKLKRLGSLFPALVLSIGALLTISFSGVAHAATGTYYEWTGDDSSAAGEDSCTNNCWSVYGNWEVSTNGGSSYSPATSGEIPNNTDNSGAGDNLVFDDTDLSSSTTLTDDITGLNVDSITFQGNNGDYYYTIAGNSFNLANGVINNDAFGSIGYITAQVTLTADQTFEDVDYRIYVMNLDTNSFNLTITSNEHNIYLGVITGTGSITAGSGSFVYFTEPSPNYSGNITVQNNADIINNDDSNDFGTGLITIQNGGEMDIIASGSILSISNPFSLAGEGIGGDYGAITFDGAGANSTLTLTGAVTLTADTQVVNPYYSSGETSPPSNTVTFDFTGDITYNGFTLTDPANSSTILVLPAASTANTSTSAPKTPDTGIGLDKTSIIASIAGTLMIVTGLALIAKKYKPSLNTKK